MANTDTVPSVEVSSDETSRDLASQFANRLNTGSTPQTTQHSDKFGDAPHNASVSVKKEWALLRDPVIHTERLDAIRSKKGYIIDMDGVIYHVSRLSQVKKI